MEDQRSFKLYAVLVPKDNGKLHWIGRERLSSSMLVCHDEETGGFTDRPGSVVDALHILFGFAVLELVCPVSAVL